MNDTAIIERTGEVVQLPSNGMPVVTLEQAKARYNQLVRFASEIMREGHDYGVIPGTEKKAVKDKNGRTVPDPSNNTLLKPGAEKLCLFFGLTPVFEQEDSSIVNFDTGMFHISYNCILLRNAKRVIADGKPVVVGDYAGSGIGSCNSREKKYRRGARACPECGAATIKKSRFPPPRDNPQAEPGWYCFAKEGGCGREFAADDRNILEQSMTVDAGASADLVNTIQKMAMKRAYVSAALIATNASDFFTQDIDSLEIHDRPLKDKPEQSPQPGANETAAALKRVAEAEQVYVGKAWCDPDDLFKYLASLGQQKKPVKDWGPKWLAGLEKCIQAFGAECEKRQAHDLDRQPQEPEPPANGTPVAEAKAPTAQYATQSQQTRLIALRDEMSLRPAEWSERIERAGSKDGLARLTTDQAARLRLQLEQEKVGIHKVEEPNEGDLLPIGAASDDIPF